MFKLSQKADYGLILLSALSRKGGLVSVSSVAQQFQIPGKFLSQIALELKKANIVTSKEGTKGGYKLAREPKEIKILDVLKILDGDLVVGSCFEDEQECVCGAGGMWKDLKKQMEKTMGSKTVADLVNE